MGTGLLVPIIYITTLCCASVQDIRTKEVGDCIHIIIAITAFIGFDRANLPAMLLGAVLTAIPLLVAACVKQGSIGGADIKLMAASGLLLGAARGILALCIGLFLGVTCTYLYRKLNKRDTKTSFPLVPFLSAGCVVAYLL